MLELGTLTLRNFLSYGNNVTSIPLNFAMAALIQGRNLDAIVDGQIDSNGSGKTTILNGILYVCFGKVLSGLTKGDTIAVTDLVNNINNKNLEVTITFKKDNFYYKIERYRKYNSRGGNGVLFMRKDTRDGDFDPKLHDITNAGVTDIDAEIERVLGMPYEIASRIVIISAKSPPFLSLGLPAQREIIEELFGFTEVSMKAEPLRKLISANNAELDKLKALNDVIKAELERYKIQLTTSEAKVVSWNQNKDIKLVDLKNKIKLHDDTYGSIDFDDEERKIEIIEKYDLQLSEQTSNIVSLKKELADVNNKLLLLNNWDTKHNSELDTLALELNKPLIFKTVEETQEFSKALLAFDNETAKLKVTVGSIESDLKLFQQKLSNKETNLIQATKALDKLKVDLNHLENSKCPYCTQQFVESKDKMISKHAELVTTETTIKTLQTDIDELKKSISVKTEELDKINIECTQSITDKNSFIVDILGSTSINLNVEYQKTANYQKLLNEFVLKEKETNPFLSNGTSELLNILKLEKETSISTWTAQQQQILVSRHEMIVTQKLKTIKDITTVKLNLDSLLSAYEVASNEVNPHQDALDQLKNQTLPTTKTDEIQELYDLVEHQDFLLKLLTKKDSYIRKALVNRYIPLMNERIREYLTLIGLPHKVEFQQDMTVKISQFKSELKFVGLSSGQQARVNIALAFAFRDLLQSRFGSINFCILDECLDIGLGNVGVQLAAKMVKNIARKHNLSMFIISHKDEISAMFEAKVMVELKNGFSEIIYSDVARNASVLTN